ncbi:hypothetical protein EJ02DRAFT_89766 [Clathrospora elynae]|uniref:Rhodopsin domain-containing protein n=1 Tax=Clathrospora elynae TaxID=706981 RepID=A0A6A5T4B4_9PLEO|nr:hypothetical protein EJ02DRAFT_89766 [Clathrospora elynae]
MANAHLQELLLLGRITFYLIITLVVLSYLAVSLRLLVRHRITKSPGWDDVAMVASLLLFTCYCTFILVITSRSHERKLFSEEARHVTLIYVQLSEIFYILTTTFLKMSMGLFFLRVLTQKWQMRLFHVILAISATYGLFYAVVTLFQCGNPANLADSLIGSKKCLPAVFMLTSGYVYGILNVLADWTFVLIPISVLVDSELDRRSKISVSLVMCLGAVGSVSAIFRMVYLHGLRLSGTGLTTTTIKATIFASTEPGTGIIAASIATLRPLFRKLATDVRSHRKTLSLNHPRKGSHSHSSSRSADEEDGIALTSQAANNKTSMHSIRDDDPWSPTVFTGTVNVQKMVVVKGHMNPAVERPEMIY